MNGRPLLFVILFSNLVLLTSLLVRTAAAADPPARPNILVAICDDQSYPHASAYGYEAISTPGFDRIAAAGVRFDAAVTPAPGCSPMRAAFLTGREIWEIGPAGTHASSFPADLPVYTTQLEQAGYHVGSTGKGWGPGKHPGWPHNPAGKPYNDRKLKAPRGVSDKDYAANFQDFLADRDADQPFCFWYGGHETHRGYDSGIGRKNDVVVSAEEVPPFLPDAPAVREDVADYLYEIQWFDSHLQRMLEFIEDHGELENTLVIVTSDNGMPFPRAKANLYEYGIHMPLAIAWPASVPAGGVIKKPVSLIDVTRTIFSAAGVTPKGAGTLNGQDLLPAMRDASQVANLENQAYSGRERHSSSRFDTLSYPSRCVRDDRFLYIRNFKPERWPAGTPQKFASVRYRRDGSVARSELGPPHGGYHDIDDGPTLQYMIEHLDDDDVQALFQAAVGLRPQEELYDVIDDPGCLNDLINDPKFSQQRRRLRRQLQTYLTRTDDLRLTDPEAAEVWESYPRYSPLRWFETPDWAEQHPDRVPEMPWLEERRPRVE